MYGAVVAAAMAYVEEYDWNVDCGGALGGGTGTCVGGDPYICDITEEAGVGEGPEF